MFRPLNNIHLKFPLPKLLLLPVKNPLNLLHVIWLELNIQRPITNTKRQFHFLDICGDYETCRVRHVACIYYRSAGSCFLGVGAEEDDVFAAPAETGCADWEGVEVRRAVKKERIRGRVRDWRVL